jgi:hypothetical protein
MAKKEITPIDPETKATDEVEDEGMTDAERKTMNVRGFRKTAHAHLI